MQITKETVKYAADLARIELESKELDKLAKQLKGILDFIDKLSKLNIRDIEPTSHILPVSNALREDTPGNSLPVDKALGSAPQKEGNSFAVPKVVE